MHYGEVGCMIIFDDTHDVLYISINKLLILCLSKLLQRDRFTIFENSLYHI
jgi:hypothetical protein